ncbi:MAG TPA: hypothetical protein VG755_39750 [Nannocystaceae bacterium]|nr:hypothetical protein [Nannocystaceae bacterium]
MSLLCAPACADKELDASDPAKEGEACVPDDQEGRHCESDLACEPTTENGYVCGAPFVLRGQVVDALSGVAIPDAIVAALDETGSPIGDAARTDANGNYELTVVALRDPDGELASMVRWTMFSVALDYTPFPGGVRPAIPVDASAPTDGKDDDDHDVRVVENATTTIALIPADMMHTGGRTIEGTIGGEHPGGTLVVAEGKTVPAPYTIADRSGNFVLFNVQGGATSIRGYRRGLELEPAMIDPMSSGKVELEVLYEDEGLATVSGSVNIVNAPGGSMTSVVLVPSSVYDAVLERGPVPAGLRAPRPPGAPSVSSAFTIDGVPGAEYHVLAAFENDTLVRDPDTSIGGTEQQIVMVPSAGNATVPESFKITEALQVIGPGAETPEIVTGAPMLVWADDSSEDQYQVVVFDALGKKVWEDLDVPRVTGSGNVTVAYEGPLTPGMYYQFRATSMKDGVPISRTEDLRGVFVIATP